MSAYMMPLNSLVPLIARMLFDELPPKVNFSELQQKIFTYVKGHKVFLLLDNVDEAGHQLFDFITQWGEATNSFLILTMRSIPTSVSLPPNCIEKSLDGITTGWLMKDLLGDKMVERITRYQMWEELNALNGNPQKLLYLRWRSPKNKDDIAKCIQDLAQGAKGLEAIESILNRIKLPLNHFLVLGRIRVPEIDEDLLAFLWDRLARGGTELYVQTIQKLLTEKLLESVERWKLRVNPHVHAQLQQACEQILGPEQRSYIEYYIAVYFRKRFSKERNAEFRIRDLENYVYHMIRSGNFESAYTYVFESDVLDMAHSRGLSLELESILLDLDNCIKEKFGSSETLSEDEKARLTMAGARIKLDLARICKDLSRHKESLEHLGDTAQFLESYSNLADDEMFFHRLHADIEHYRGVAYSQIGNTYDCVRAYFNSISYGSIIIGRTKESAVSHPVTSPMANLILNQFQSLTSSTKS